MREAGITLFPEIELALLYLIAAGVLLVRPAGLFGRLSMGATFPNVGPTVRSLVWIVPAALLLLVAPLVIDPFQTLTLTYGLVAAIAALGFNLLLGYTGLLSFGHSAFFGGGAYTVAFMVKYLKIASMELFLAGSVLVSALLSILFGFGLRALYAHLLRHPHPRPVAGPVEPGVPSFSG